MTWFLTHHFLNLEVEPQVFIDDRDGSDDDNDEGIDNEY